MEQQAVGRSAEPEVRFRFDCLPVRPLTFPQAESMDSERVRQ